MSETQAVSPELAVETTNALAEYSSRLAYRDLPAAVRTFAKHCLLDWTGVTLAGCTDETSLIALAEARDQGGHPQATIVGYSDRTSVVQAALVNGTFSHALDYDDVNAALTGHPTAAIAPAVLALAERDGHRGEQVIEAFVTGVEVVCRIGQLVTSEHYARGFHATGTVGTIGAAAAAARLLGLDAATTQVAFGIAATQAAGLKSMFGTMCKPLHAGKAASNGVYAALLAKRGFTARPDVLECEQGFCATHTSEISTEQALAGLGTDFHTARTLFKYHAACYGTHATIEAAALIRERHQVALQDVQSYEVRVPLQNLRMCDIAEPRTGLEAKFSLRMTAAMALAGESTSYIDNYNEALCQKPGLLDLIRRAKIVGDARQSNYGAEVTVRTRDGVVYKQSADAGVPETNLERQERRLSEKFRSIATPVVGADKVARLTRGLLALERAPNLVELTSDMVP